jgi:hypothetical protein
MTGIDNSLVLGVGNISFHSELGGYYQDISPSLKHLEDGVFGSIDENGIPYLIHGEQKSYAPITIIQYALANYDLFVKGNRSLKYKERIVNCVNWLVAKSEEFKDAIVIRLKPDSQYNLPNGWISGMVQGQFLSLLLRAFQLLEDRKYLLLAEKVYNSFKYSYDQGGFRKIDQHGYIWFEEYNTKEPSLVLNGFIYTMFGILDYYRVTNEIIAKELWDDCVSTTENNLYKYHTWYWSRYDQNKKQLVSYYYQKNVHVPLMEIMYLLTKKEIFNTYAISWRKSLNSPIHRFVTEIMYRVQPRLKKLKCLT